ncbi:MAG: protein-L-isoaspartate O-methyltransferase [Thermoplasmatales archaeon]|nr:protein-L-isoaspartate O-methyltransferase [Thermoplasmatales archaeon]
MYEEERKALVRHLVRRGYISKHDVVKAMENVPRHLFIPENMQKYAYEDCPLEIGFGQTISAPHMVGIMVESLDVRGGQKILEVGTGLGYHSAVVSSVVGDSGHVYTIERYSGLAEKAKENLKNYKNVEVIVADGSKGLKEHAPYDRIFVTCAAPDIPEPLIEQLKGNGKLLIPVGERFMQDLILLEKKNNKISKRNLGGCMFVPLVGEYGFR